MLNSDSSVRRWVERLQSGDDLAAQKLWETFFDRLVHLARGRLSVKHRKVIDAEDVALSAFDSFCRGVERGRFPKLNDRDDLWRLLVTMTIHKVLHVVRDEKRIKRGGQFHELRGLDDSSDAIAAVNQVVGREPSPQFAAQVAEEYQKLMSALESEELVELATLKLEGYTNEEIAARWGRAVRTVERKLALIRKVWLKEMSEQ